jgi:hypothetical protein
MPQTTDTREVRIIDELGFDITDRIIVEYGSIEAWEEHAAQIQAVLAEGLDRLTATLG